MSSIAKTLVKSLASRAVNAVVSGVINKGRKSSRIRGNLRGTKRSQSAFAPLYRQLQPKLYRVKMRNKSLFNHTIDPPTTAGTTSSTFLNISCNGIFNPSTTNVLGQPMGFDQLMAMYDHYTVVSSKIKITLFLNGVDRPIACTLMVMDTENTALGIERTSEQYGARIKYLSGNPAGGNNKVSISKTWSARKTNGQSGKRLLMDDQLQGSSTANPAEEWFYHLEVGNLFDTANPSPLTFTIEQDYNVIFHERRSLLQSTE